MEDDGSGPNVLEADRIQGIGFKEGQLKTESVPSMSPPSMSPPPSYNTLSFSLTLSVALSWVCVLLLMPSRTASLFLR